MYLILFIILFFQGLSSNYLAIYRRKFDDCLKAIYTINNDVSSGHNTCYDEYYKAWDNIHNISKNSFIENEENYKELYYKRQEDYCTGEYNQEEKDLPLNKVSYDYGTYIHFEFADTDPTEGSMKISIKINEYIISTSHWNSHSYWRCHDCNCASGADRNFATGSKDSDTILLFHDKNVFVNKSLDKSIEYYYHFSFKINSLEDVKKQYFDVNPEFFTIKTQTIYLSYHIERVPEVIELINFNITDNFFITQDSGFIFEYQNYYFKIEFLDGNTYQGRLEAYDITKTNKINLASGNDFRISDTEGIK